MGNDVKKVLLVYYSQTGQLAELARNFAEPLQQGGVHVDCVNLEPQEPYPFPWSFWRFFNTFPETVHLKPAPILPPAIPANDYDAVVIAYSSRPRSRLPLSCNVKKPAACSTVNPW